MHGGWTDGQMGDLPTLCRGVYVEASLDWGNPRGHFSWPYKDSAVLGASAFRPGWVFVAELGR